MKRVEFKVTDELHSSLLKSVSLSALPRTTFPRGFLVGLICPYLEAYVRDPRVLERILKDNLKQPHGALDEALGGDHGK